MWRKMADPDVTKALLAVLERVKIACERRPEHLRKFQTQLVAASKTKPVEMIATAYQGGQRHFGENYVQELVEKGNSKMILDQCKDIKWHFIGHLQGNKVNKVLRVPNLFMIETVHSMKIAEALDNSWNKLQKSQPLQVMVQVNTSQEENKHGCKSSEASQLVRCIISKCPNLKLVGLMTIGAYEVVEENPNPDFQMLVKCREEVCQKEGLAMEDLELSMGMSHDFEHAIELGSTNVRVGCCIFGPRAYEPIDD